MPSLRTGSGSGDAAAVGGAGAFGGAKRYVPGAVFSILPAACSRLTAVSALFLVVPDGKFLDDARDAQRLICIRQRVKHAPPKDTEVLDIGIGEGQGALGGRLCCPLKLSFCARQIWRAQ